MASCVWQGLESLSDSYVTWVVWMQVSEIYGCIQPHLYKYQCNIQAAHSKLYSSSRWHSISKPRKWRWTLPEWYQVHCYASDKALSGHGAALRWREDCSSSGPVVCSSQVGI